MSLLTRELLKKAELQDASRQRQVQAQMSVINRLLEARGSEAGDGELIRALCDERRAMQEELMLHKATTQLIVNLLAAEDGAIVISVDLIQDIINDGAEGERLHRERADG